jgi:hypothetical protein
MNDMIEHTPGIFFKTSSWKRGLKGSRGWGTDKNDGLPRQVKKAVSGGGVVTRA